MALTRWGFESGVNGDALNGTNSNSDFAVVTGGTSVISTAQSFEGTRSALFVATSTSGANYFQKTITATGQLGVDIYLYITALPSASTSVLWAGASTTRNVNLGILTDGRVRLFDGGGSGGATLWTSTATLSLNTWYRLSLFATQNPTTGTVRAAVFAGNATTPLADSTLLTAQNTGASQFSTLRIGTKTSTSTAEMTGYFDNYGYDIAASNLLPVASAPIAQATTSAAAVLIDATSSSGTGLTYQISQTAGPTKTATSVATGKWLVPIDPSQDTEWEVTVEQSDEQTDTTTVTVPNAQSETPPVELLYATGPGVFV